MRTIGLLGGMSWHSTLTYYERINQAVADTLGTERSAPILLHSVDQGALYQAERTGAWRQLGHDLGRAALGLQHAGANGLFVCSNTIHHLLPVITAQLRIPAIHIADCVADAAVARGHRTVGLLGTAFTVRRTDYVKRLQAHGLTVVVNEDVVIDRTNRLIVDELTQGRMSSEATEHLSDAVDQLADRGATVALLSCTELGLALTQAALPLIDSAHAHADAAAAWCLGEAPSG